ncbi:MAG: hypothetical protein ACMUJM_04150 [bacterium]
MEGFKYLEYLKEIPGSTYKDIGKEFNISKARVSQMIALITRLPEEIIDFLISKNESEYLSYFTERRLRPLTKIKNPELQREKFGELLRAYHS